MTDKPTRYPRPLSPHLQIYRVQLTSFLSVLHRATGIILMAGGYALVGWVVALATGPEVYQVVHSLLHTWFSQLALWGWVFCAFYHLANGVRHLFWDAGRGFALPQVYVSGWVVVLVSLSATALLWWYTL